MAPPPEPLRQLPFTARPFRRETIGSFLTRLASANRIRVPSLLGLAAISIAEQRDFTPATDRCRGWSPSTPSRIAALAGRPADSLAAAFPPVAEFAAQLQPAPRPGKLQRACRHCAAAQNIAGMVIVRARPHDYLCLRHRLWHNDISDIDLRPLPQVTNAQRSHDRHVRALPAADVASAHRQALGIIDEWITRSSQQALTTQWQHRLRLLDAEDARHPSPHLNAATHPELLAVASLLLTARHRVIDVEREVPSRLGFPFQPSADDPLVTALRGHEKDHLR